MTSVDVGGIFTDFSVLDSETKRLFHYKHSSTPDDPPRFIVSGVHYILESEGIGPAAVEYLTYEITAATNMLIEKRGARMGLITAKGLKDLMETGSQKRPPLCDLFKEKPESLIPSGLKCEVEEHLLHDGSAKIPLNEEDVREVIRFFQEQSVTTITVCTPFPFINPAHERRIREIILGEHPEAYVPISSKLVSELHEYSRTNTTVFNAYLDPVMKKYIENFQNSTRESGTAAVPYITQPNGSIISITETVEYPIRATVSGLNTGMMGTTYIGRQCGIDKIVTFDMGGTSTDINLIKGGEAQVSYGRMVEDYLARVSIIDIITVSTGGGLVVTVDEGGTLKVGLRNAGAVPGPAYYMRGDESPTVADTNILLSKLNRHRVLDGRMDVDWNLAYDAIQKKTSGESSLSVEDAAVGIISVVNSNMVRATRVVSVERGYDIREFILMAFGGVGPLYTCEVTRELGIAQVLLPPAPGMFRSLGLLMVDARLNSSQSHIMIAAPQNSSEVNRIFSQLTEEGNKMLKDEDIAKEDRVFPYSLGYRYERQNYKITVELPTGGITEEILSGLVEQFHQEHGRSCGYYDKKKDTQMVNYHVGTVGTIDKPDLSERPVEENPQVPTPVEVHKIRFEGSSEYLGTNIYQCTQLLCGCTVSGPVITEQVDSISTVPPGWQAYNDPFLNLIATYHGDETA